jgi:hypothetical protein
LHAPNALAPNIVNVFGKVTDVKELQPLKHPSPRPYAELGQIAVILPKFVIDVIFVF